MRRIRLFLAVAAIMLATLVSGSVLPALAQVDYPPEPAPPECDWYPYADYLVDAYGWDYWCYRDGQGWKLVYEHGYGSTPEELPRPANPQCDWYFKAEYIVDDYWWEYKCVWPPAGWKFVYQVGGYNYPYQV